MAVKRSSNHAVKRRPTVSAEEAAHKRALEIEKKCYKYGGIAVAVILVLVLLNSFDLLPHLNGSLRYYNGSVRGVSETDIITCADKTAHRYFNIGTMVIPEGYSNDTEKTTTDDNGVKEWYLNRDGDDKLQYVYVKGVSKSPDEMYDTVYNYNSLTDSEGNVTAVPVEYSGKTDAGIKYRAMVSPANEDTYNNNYVKYAICYLEAGHGCSILVMAPVRGATAEDFPADEVILGYAKDVMNSIKVK